MRTRPAHGNGWATPEPFPELSKPIRPLPKPMMPRLICRRPQKHRQDRDGHRLAIARCIGCRSMTSLIGGRTTAIKGALSGVALIADLRVRSCFGRTTDYTSPVRPAILQPIVADCRAF